MAFLDNSGDIILDAVLTDTGRLRLAQGDGSFKISKFALGDDEINYTLYNKNHASGSAFNDLEVLQTPVLEAFTNNTSNLKTKLISISRTNVLYMPVLKLNMNDDGAESVLHSGYNSKFFSRTITNGGTGTNIAEQDRFYIAVDNDTLTACKFTRESGTSNTAGNVALRGMIKGFKGGTSQNDFIRVDQGLDTNQIPASLGLDSDLFESAYIIELDYRLGRLRARTESEPQPVNFIDDDNIASYYVTDAKFINTTLGDQTTTDNGAITYDQQKLNEASNTMVFEGPRGSMLGFALMASQELASSTYLFNQIGDSVAANSTTILGFPSSNDPLIQGKTIYYIDSTVRVIGANTGFRLDIPVRYIKVA